MTQELNPTIPADATDILNRQAANYGDEAIYEYSHCVEIQDSSNCTLAFRQIVNEQIVKIVCLDFIIDANGILKAN